MTLYFSQAHFSLLGLRLCFFFFSSSAVVYLQCFPQQFEEVQQVPLVKFFCSRPSRYSVLQPRIAFATSPQWLSLLHSFYWLWPLYQAGSCLWALPLLPLCLQDFLQIFPWWAACPGLIFHRTCSMAVPVILQLQSSSFYLITAFHGLLFWTMFYNLLIIYFPLLKYRIHEIVSVFFDRESKGSDT